MKGKTREPIRQPWIWIVFAILLAVLVPWYVPEGSFRPLLWGVPYWAAIIIGASFALSVFLTYVLRYEWQIEEDAEQRTEQE